MQENAKPQGEEKNFDIQIPPSQEPKVVETLWTPIQLALIVTMGKSQFHTTHRHQT